MEATRVASLVIGQTVQRIMRDKAGQSWLSPQRMSVIDQGHSHVRVEYQNNHGYSNGRGPVVREWLLEKLCKEAR